MIGLLRFVGIANAAVWFGTVVFYTISIAPAMGSVDARAILGEGNFPFVGGALAEMLRVRYFHFHLFCATVALLHLGAEWVYLGRFPRRFWLWLLVGMFWVSLLGAVWLGPKLQQLHRARYFVNVTPAQRELSARAFRLWVGLFHVVNLALLGGSAGCLWRAAHPPDELRFVGTPKFRG